MFNDHSLIPWGSFQGRQDEKWGSFRSRDHFGVDLGIISGLRIISGAAQFSFLGFVSEEKVSDYVSDYVTMFQIVQLLATKKKCEY